VFYIDVAGHAQEAHVAAALSALQAQSSFFKVLGSFPLDPH
jgi:chorismate mutase / prephenate dehydratase